MESRWDSGWPARCTASRSSSRCDFFLTKFLTRANSKKIMPHHSKASSGSQHCCDKLLDSLRLLIPDVTRFQSQETCALYVPGMNRFAHVYHRGKEAVVRVYFRGDISLTISEHTGSVVVQRREKIEKGWDKEFPFFASVSTDESISALAKLLAAVAYPLSEKSEKVLLLANWRTALL